MLLLKAPFTGGPGCCAPNAGVGDSPGGGLVPRRATGGPPPEPTTADTVENSVCPKRPSSWLDACPWNVVAPTERLWHWSCAGLGARPGQCGSCSFPLIPRSARPLSWVRGSATGRARVAAVCLMASKHVSIASDGIAQGERYWSARGEILRPLQDPRQRRRSAGACSSIKDESPGNKDDQTPS